MGLFEIFIMMGVFAGGMIHSYMLGIRQARSETVVDTLVFARDKRLLKDEDSIQWQYLDDNMQMVLKSIINHKI